MIGLVLLERQEYRSTVVVGVIALRCVTLVLLKKNAYISNVI